MLVLVVLGAGLAGRVLRWCARRGAGGGAGGEVVCWRILPSRVEESFTAQVELGDDFDFGDHAIIVNVTSHPLSL